jgi:hypothetical protein
MLFVPVDPGVYVGLLGALDPLNVSVADGRNAPPPLPSDSVTVSVTTRDGVIVSVTGTPLNPLDAPDSV